MLVLFAYLLYLFLNTYIYLPFQIMADYTSPSKIPKIHHPEADVIRDRIQLLAVRHIFCLNYFALTSTTAYFQLHKPYRFNINYLLFQ